MAVTHYLWDFASDVILTETDENHALLAEYTNEPGLHGQLISQGRASGRFYHHFDGEANTRQVTDQNENTVESATYSAFGEVTATSGTITNPFGYKGALGYYANGESGDYSTECRLYGPQIGRWMSPSPLSTERISNPYIFMGNRPSVELVTDVHLFQDALGVIVWIAAGQLLGNVVQPNKVRKSGWFRCDTNRWIRVGHKDVEAKCNGCDVDLRYRVSGRRCFRYDQATGQRVQPEDDPQNTFVIVQVHQTGTISCPCQAIREVDFYDNFEMSYGCLIGPDLQNLFTDFVAVDRDYCKFLEDFREAVKSMPPCR